MCPFYCAACRNPVAYSYGSAPEVFVGVSQGCYPRGTQLREGESMVNYWSDGTPLGPTCHTYFSSLLHAEVSEQMVQALKEAGMLSERGEIPSEEVEEDTLMWENSQDITHSPRTKRRAEPWPSSRAPFQSTRNARIKSMGSANIYLSKSASAVGTLQDRKNMEVQYIPHPSHLTVEAYRDAAGFPIPISLRATTSSKIDQLQSAARMRANRGAPDPGAPAAISAVAFKPQNWKVGPYGAMLSRQSLATTQSARRLAVKKVQSWESQFSREEDAYDPENNRGSCSVSAPASGPPRTRTSVSGAYGEREEAEKAPSASGDGDVFRTQSSPTPGRTLSSGNMKARGAGVVFDDGTAPGTHTTPDRLGSVTAEALKVSVASKPQTAGPSVRKGDPMGTILEVESPSIDFRPTTSFKDCERRCREMLDEAAKTVGKRVGANGQVVDEDFLRQCSAAAPARMKDTLQLYPATGAQSAARQEPDGQPAQPAGHSKIASEKNPLSRFRTGSSASSLLTGAKFAARFRQKVFQKQDAVIVSGSDATSVEGVKNGIRLFQRADKIVSNFNLVKEKAVRESIQRGVPLDPVLDSQNDKTFFEDTPWCPTFDATNACYFNGGHDPVNIGLDRTPTPQELQC